MTQAPPAKTPPAQTPRAYAGIFARGLCMGAADLVPGVSGGTIAFISGIYDRLLAALAAFAAAPLWRALLRGRIGEAWRLADANFLAVLFAGLLLAVVALAGVLKTLLETRPHLLLGFFFGLVLASIFVVWRQNANMRALHWGLAAIAAALTLLLVEGAPPPVFAEGGALALFLGGMVAICAMLLPGISGSYVLLILGLYPVVLAAASARDLPLLMVFAAGCGFGMLAFARLLSAALRRWRVAVVSCLLGVMAGALPKIWPWKEAAEGAKIIMQKNILPVEYAGGAQTPAVLALAAAGAALVFALHFAAARVGGDKAARRPQAQPPE